MLNATIKSSIDRLWDKFWSGGISNPLTAIEQISYLLFMKRLDEYDIKKRRDAEFTGEKFVSLFSGDKESYRWSHFRQMEGGEMLTHIQTKVFPFLKSLGEEESHFARHMGNAVFIISKPSLLVEAINIIDNIFEEISRQQSQGQEFQDTQGDIYEFLLSEITSAGKLGQFRTPRHIIQLMCELVDPKLGDTICDPACGTGGFLLGAYQHILTAHTSKEYLITDENGLSRGSLGDKLTDERQWKHLKAARNVDGATAFSIMQNGIAKWEDAGDGVLYNSISTNVLGNGSTTSATLVADNTAADGVNEVYFGSIADSSAIAVTTVWGYFGGPARSRQLLEWDMVFDDVKFDWATDGTPSKMDFDNIATHELGHAVGLADLYNSCILETMYGYGTEGETQKRDLNTGDIQGFNNLY